MSLTRNAEGIIGSYSGTLFVSGGRITGSVQESVLTGFWLQETSATYCDTAHGGTHYWGKVRFIFDEDIAAFSGKWSYCDDALRNGWTGDRK